MKHEFKKTEDGIPVCEKCGYVTKSIPRQKCPMSLLKLKQKRRIPSSRPTVYSRTFF